MHQIRTFLIFCYEDQGDVGAIDQRRGDVRGTQKGACAKYTENVLDPHLSVHYLLPFLRSFAAIESTRKRNTSEATLGT